MRPQALISVPEVMALGTDKVRIADARWYLNKPGAGRAAYDAGHIPGAIFVDLDTDLSDEQGLGAPGRHPLPAEQAFAQRMGELGFGSDDFIVVYDDMGGTIASRLWWMLDNLGHRGGVAVLDGGVQAWQAADQPLTTDATVAPPATMELAPDWHGVIERADLAPRLGEVTLIDARAGERYRGEIEPVDPKAGHVPTAINVPVSDNVDGSGRFRDAAELRALYGGVLNDEQPTIVSCGSGVTACHDALAMRVAGFADPILYVGSFSDWSRSGMPVSEGAEPGDA